MKKPIDHEPDDHTVKKAKYDLHLISYSCALTDEYNAPWQRQMCSKLLLYYILLPLFATPFGMGDVDSPL